MESAPAQEESLSNKLGKLLRTNKVAILLEIVVVLLPLYLGLVINDRSGIDHIPLVGSTVLFGGPAKYLGLIDTIDLVTHYFGG